MNNRIILPMDNMPWLASLELMKYTQGKVWGYKIRRQIFEKGIDFLKIAKAYGNIMVDLKFYDIPSAMTEAIKFFELADIITVHCNAMYIPQDNGIDKLSTKLAGVTILTSMNDGDVNMIYRNSIKNQIDLFASFAEHHDYGYIVCSAADLVDLKNTGIKKICPGIRPSWYQDKNDDQNRTMTPVEAVKAGADLLVIGRPILKAKDIIKALDMTNHEMLKLEMKLKGLL